MAFLGAPVEQGVSWAVEGQAPKWNHSPSTEAAFLAVRELPPDQTNKGFFVSIRFESITEGVKFLERGLTLGMGDMGTVQWMFGDHWAPAYYDPVRWSRLASFHGALTELDALPVKQRPVRINMKIKTLSEAIAKILHQREATPSTETTEVAKLKKQLQERDSMIHDLHLEMDTAMTTFVGRYFLEKKSNLPPLALRILTYWFGQDFDGINVAPKQYHLWFGKSEETDREIKLLFGGHLDAAADGLYDEWAQEPLGIVALDILLDQFPRNIFRNTARSFAYDWKAFTLTSRALSSKFDDQLTVMERVWLYLVFTHSEDAQVQHECVSLAKEKLGDMEENFRKMWITIFEKHETVIQKFGRFPHRNTFMCRHSTPDEEAFVNDVRFRFDLPVVLTKDPETGAYGFNFVTSASDSGDPESSEVPPPNTGISKHKSQMELA